MLSTISVARSANSRTEELSPSSLAGEQRTRVAPPTEPAPPPRGLSRAELASSVALLLALVAVVLTGMLWWQYRQFYVSLDQTDAAAAESLTLKQADGLMKEVKLAVGTMGPLPSKQDRDDLTVRLQAVRTSLAPRIQELREAEEWKRWANVQVQEELCSKMEALVAIAEADPEKAANEMRQLQERWKPVAAAPRRLEWRYFR